MTFIDLSLLMFTQYIRAKLILYLITEHQVVNLFYAMSLATNEICFIDSNKALALIFAKKAI